MSIAKEEVRKMLDQIRDDASFEDIQYHIYVQEKIEHGMKDIEEGRVLSQEEVDDEVFYQYGIVKFKPGTDFNTVMESSEMKVVGDDVMDFVPESKFQFIPITQTLYES